MAFFTGSFVYQYLLLFSVLGAKHRSQAGSDVQCKQNAVLSYISYLQVLEDIRRPYSFYWRNVFICLLNNLLNKHIVLSWMPIIFSYAYNCLLSWIGQRLIILKFCDHDLCLHNWSWLESLDQVIWINNWKFSVITKLAMTL